MSSVLKSVLALKKGADAAKWLAAEQSVIQNLQSLTNSDFASVTRHFGEQQAGSTEFWQKLDSRTQKIVNDLATTEMEHVFEGFGQAPYQPSKQLNKILVEAWFGLGEYYLQQETEKNPYFLQERGNQVESTLPKAFRDKIASHLAWVQSLSNSANQTSLISEYTPETDEDGRLVLDSKDKALYEEWKKAVGNKVQAGKQSNPHSLENFVTYK